MQVQDRCSHLPNPFPRVLCVTPKRTSEQNRKPTTSLLFSCFCAITITSILSTSWFVPNLFRSRFHGIWFPNHPDRGICIFTRYICSVALSRGSRELPDPEVCGNPHPSLWITTCNSHCWNSRSFEELVVWTKEQSCPSWNRDCHNSESLPLILSKFSFHHRAEETKGTKCIKAPFCTHRSDYTW